MIQDYKQLIEYLKIPSVSTDLKHAKDVKKAASWVERKLASLGLNVDVKPTSGHPIIIASSKKLDPNKPTVLVYGHYDVQPAEPISDWTHPPFNPTIKNGNLYARGSSDNKGQFYCHIAAIEKLASEGKVLPVNIKFLVEGEEEIGSPNLEKFIKEQSSSLKSDVVWITDGLAVGPKLTPTINVSLRGSLKFSLTIYGPKTDVHSGSYGGAIPNPANLLTQAAASMWNPSSGKVTIAGFYNNVQDYSQVSNIKSPLSDASFRAKTGVSKLMGEEGYSSYERTGVRPTIQITGMSSGYLGSGYKNIVPASSQMKVNIRTVPNQQGPRLQSAISNHFKKIIPKGIRYTLEFSNSTEPFSMSPDHKSVKIVKSAMKKAFSQNPITYREGGTLPAANYFKDHLKIPVLLTGWAEDMHVPDEKISLSLIKKGTQAVIEFWTLLAAN